MPTELIFGAISFLLTLMVLSYLIGDNALFRFAIHIFVGVSAGYVASVALYQVIWPYLLIPLVSAPLAERGLLIIPLVLSALLLMKISPRLSWLGGPAVGYLVGAGAAVAIGGAALGTPASGMLKRLAMSGNMPARGLRHAQFASAGCGQ